MAEPLPEADLDTAVDPDRVSHQDFEIERRGYDQRQVRAYLIAVAESLRDAQAREADMRMRLGRAVRRAESAEEAASESKASTSDSDVTRQIGDEVTGVLDAARVAGEQRVAAAEASAQQILANAKQEASELRGAAETVMAERSADADVAAAKIVEESQGQAAAIRDKARQDHERARRHAMAMVGKARNESDSLIHEAEQARAQILEDMDRRRREARAQVERLRVGRDRLLRSYEVVRRSLDESTTELKTSLAEAKVRGDSAARRVLGEPAASRPQLEAEIADARLTGLIRVTEPPAAEPSPEADRDAAVAASLVAETVAPEAEVAEVAETVVADTAPAESPEPAAEIEVPNLDLRGRSLGASTFAKRVAPSPSRPRVGIPETNDPAIRVVPKPPVVAPIIRREEPVAEDEPVADEVEVEAEVIELAPEVEVVEPEAEVVELDEDLIDAQWAEVERQPDETSADGDVEEVDIALVEAEPEVVEAAVIEAEPEVVEATVVEAEIDEEPELVEVEELESVEADTEIEAAAAEVVEEAEEVEEDLDAVFAAELPDGELAIIEPDDEIETVRALTDEVVAEEDAEEEEPDVDVDIAEAEIETGEAEEQELAEAELVEVDDSESTAAAGGLFAALREQRSKKVSVEATDVSEDADEASADAAAVAEADDELELIAAPDPDADDTDTADEADDVEAVEAGDVLDETVTDVEYNFDFDIEEVYRQRDAVVAESANQLERRLKRALADEQNELLAGVRSSKQRVELLALVGDSDEHLSRYVSAIAEVASTAYSAGMALVQTDVEATGALPAGAVEELISASIIDPIRRRLEVVGADEPETQVSTVRAFYRQRKTDDLPVVAADLASLLCTAGLCETLPPGTPLPR